VTEYTPGFKVFKKVTDMTDPGPSKTFLLLDEREDSINDGSFLTLMDGIPVGGLCSWTDRACRSTI